MTSPNGTIFRITGHLREVTGEFPHKGQWRGALICAWMNDYVNTREAGDLRRHHAHYDIILWKLAMDVIASIIQVLTHGVFSAVIWVLQTKSLQRIFVAEQLPKSMTTGDKYAHQRENYQGCFIQIKYWFCYCCQIVLFIFKLHKSLITRVESR